MINSHNVCNLSFYWFSEQQLNKWLSEFQLEQFYLQQREDRIKKLLEGMAIEERAAVDRLVDKHAQEMLFLIEEKVCCLYSFNVEKNNGCQTVLIKHQPKQ